MKAQPHALQALALAACLNFFAITGAYADGNSLEAAHKLEQQGQWKEAKAIYEDLYQSEPENYITLMNLARLTSWQKNHAEASTLYKKALALATTNEEKMAAQLGLGEVTAWKGDFKEASKIYSDAALAFPDSPEPLFRQAKVETWLYRFRKATALYQKNLDRFPTHTPSKLGLAEMYSWRGQYAKALKIYNALMIADEKNPDLWVGLGETLAWSGRLLESHKVLSEAKSLYPDNERVLLAYFQTSRYLGKPDTSVFSDNPEQSDNKSAGYAWGTDNRSNPALQTTLAGAQQNLEQSMRPTLQSLLVHTTETGTVDEKLKVQKLPMQLTFSPSSDSSLFVTFEPAFYTSGKELEREQRNAYGLGLSRQWTPSLGTSGWIGLGHYSNEGNLPIYARVSVHARPSDFWQPSLSFERYSVEESILSASGLRPEVGVFANSLVGRVIRNEWALKSLFLFPFQLEGMLNTALGVDTGEQISENGFSKIEYLLGRDLFKTYTPRWSSTTYARYEGRHWHFQDDRLGNGGAFLVVKQFGLPLGSDGVSPIPTAISPGTGGYFSPDRYLFQALLLGNRGEFWKNRVRYDLSYFAGLQDISRFGSSFANGIRLSTEIAVTKSLGLLLDARYSNAQKFGNTLIYGGFRLYL